jgi:hypothetical protein
MTYSVGRLNDPEARTSVLLPDKRPLPSILSPVDRDVAVAPLQVRANFAVHVRVIVAMYFAGAIATPSSIDRSRVHDTY